ncbi:MAG: tetratricopeptide repeat protein [Chitinophagaceae bacterium]
MLTLSLYIKKNMSYRVLFFYALFLGISQTANAGKTVFTMTDNCLKAQALLYELKLDDADALLIKEAAANSDNIAVNWLSESVIFLRIFTSEDQSIYSNYAKQWHTLIEKTEALSFNNAWYRFILSDMLIHRGLIRLKFNETFTAGSDIKSAFKHLKDNKKMFPSFLPDNKNYGFLICAFSSVPSKYQWLAKLIGFEGDMSVGLAEIEAYLKSDLTVKEHVWMKLETAFIYAMVQHHLNKNSEIAWKTIDPYTKSYKTIVLENYMRATVANYSGRNDEMLAVLSVKPSHFSGTPFYYMDYLLGLAKLRHQDSDADIYFKIFTVKYKGKNYLKSAYRYLSWTCQLKNDPATAKTYYSMAVKLGTAIIEEDKQAEREGAEALIWPVNILKARLLYDGHYLDKSLAILNTIKESELSHKKFKLELNYRKARVLHDNNDLTSAIPLYTKVIESGKSETYYYAAYSALQLGYIYEKQVNKVLAKQYFTMAKNSFPNNKEYVSSIEQKAKAALKRLGK